jgi:hypothetical protein
VSPSEEPTQLDDPTSGASQSVPHDRGRRPGEIRRIATTLLIVALLLAAVAALSIYGARHNRRSKIGFPSIALTSANSIAASISR